MAFIAPSSINSPEQQELEDKRQQLEALEAEFAARQLEYSTLAGEIAAFRNRYYLRVGSFYARLDTLRAEIREAEARRAPQDTAAHEEAMKARRQAEETCEEVEDATEDEPVSFQPSPELKQVYRLAAKVIHPDRARDEEDRLLRENLMAEVNGAYSRGDLGAISDLIEQYRDRLEAPDPDDIGKQLVRAIRAIAKTRERIANLDHAIEELKTSEWVRLKQDVEEGEARGEDPLGQLAEKLHADMLVEQQRLNEILTVEQEPVRPVRQRKGKSPSPATNEPAAFRPEGLIHRSERGEKMRSKSEVVIANVLLNLGLDYRYEYPIEGHARPGIRRPDFVCFGKDGRPVLWEHLGLLEDPEYRARWEAKREWYGINGFIEGVDLFVTRDEPDGGLDSRMIRETAERFRSRLKS